MRHKAGDPAAHAGLGIIPNVVAFALGLGFAYFSRWEVPDLVWSLWLCSLVVGYITLFSAVGASAYLGLHAIRQPSFDKTRRGLVIMVGLGIGLFILGFFSLHFGAFHAGHSVFLSMFFPVEGMPDDGFGRAFINPLLLWLLAFRHLMKPYGLFLIPVLIAERQVIFKPLFSVVREIKEAHAYGDDSLQHSSNLNISSDGHPIGKAMFRPYVNVMRMHILIFFFAACYALQVQSFIIFAVVYSVYFFPWPGIIRKLKSKRN